MFIMNTFSSITHSGILAWGLIPFLFLSACSSHIPPEIRQALNNEPNVAQARNNPDDYLSQSIRWGGVILDIENKNNATWLTIVAFPLSDRGEPQISDQSLGRFIAVVNEFLEPLVYKHDREITVTGQLLRTEKHKIGEFIYDYPVVQVNHHYLWPVRLEPEDSDYYPYGQYNPYYPWHPYYFPHRYFH